MVTTVSALLPLESGNIDLNTWLENITRHYSAEAVALIRKSCAFTQLSCEDLQTAYHTSCIDEALETANILLALNADHEAVCTALLRPALLYADIPLEDVQEQFGERLAHLLAGVQKMGAIEAAGNINSQANVVENLREMLLTMIDDVRVVLIKLAERCYMLRNLSHLDTLQQRQIARVTLTIYAQLANRLGIHELKWELEDLAFRYLEPQIYKEIAKHLNEKRLDREKYINAFMVELSRLLNAAGVKHEIYGRAKHIYSIYRKMQRKHTDYYGIYDAMACRVLVHNVEDCYKVLSIVHAEWEHVPAEFDDYVATPKPNGYRSIHTVAVPDKNKPVEVQIRTYEMHELNEQGVAAHWAYKEGAVAKSSMEQKIAWLRQLLEWQQELASEEALPAALQQNIVADRVFVFTPTGDTISLSAGSTPLDFAYHIHSEIGHRCRGAKINGTIVPLTYQLQTGDKVEIITGKESKPSRDWFNPASGYLKTPRARAKVHNWFKKLDYDHNISEGNIILERELKRFNLKNVNVEDLAKQFHLKSTDDFLAALGAGDIRSNQLANILQPRVEKAEEFAAPITPRKSDTTHSSILVAGVDDLLTHIAGCCKPLPGDAVIGYVTQGHGITVHRKDCEVAATQQSGHSDRMLEVNWGSKKDTLYTVDLFIEALENPDLLREITSLTSIEKVTIVDLKLQRNHKRLTTAIYLTLELSDIEKLAQIVAKISQLPNIYKVKRL